MDTYYTELMENIRRYQEEVNQLNNELVRLSSDANADNRTEIARIRGRIAGREHIIRENQNIINNYDTVRGYTQRLDDLFTQRDNINDDVAIANINEEISTINEALNNLGITGDVVERINEAQAQPSIFDPLPYPALPANVEVYGTDDISALVQSDVMSIRLAEQEKIAQEEYDRALNELLQVFDEERNYFGEIHEFKTDSEIEATYQHYMDMKIAAEKNRQNCLKKLNNIKEKIVKNNNSLVTQKSGATKDNTTGLIPVSGSEKGLIPIFDHSKDLVPDSNTEKGVIPIFDHSKDLMPIPGTEKGLISVPKSEELIPKSSKTASTKSTPPKPSKIETKEKKTAKRGYRRIIQDLTNDLQLGTKMGKRYTASNIKVAKGFKEELHSGNYLYNVVHFIPAIIKLPIQIIRKVSAKILLRAKDRENIKTLESRIQKLSKEDLETLFNEYVGGNIIQEHLPTIFNTLLNKKIQEYGQEKIDNINSQIRKNYIDVFGASRQIDEIDKKIGDLKTTDKEKHQLMSDREALLKGKAKVVEAILNDRAKVNKIYSSGMHGYSEDVRADSTGLSLTGKRFSKKNDLDNELQERLATLEDAMNAAIATGKDEDALLAFTRMEMLYSENTKIGKSIFGNRSEGSKIYNPIQEESLDYSADPFVRDLMTTITTTTAIIGAVNAIKTHAEADKMVDEYNKNIDNVNAHNQDAIDSAHKAGDDITGKADTFSKGIDAKSRQDVLNMSNAKEREALNQVGWRLYGKDYAKYRKIDDANHAWYNEFYQQTKSALEDVASRRANGNISAQQALEEISKINSQTQNTMSEIVSGCLDVAKQYNPTVVFDNSSIEAVMEYMTQNPAAITDMNEAIVDVVNIGESLSGLSAAQIQAFQNLPNDVATALLSTAASTALAQKVATDMNTNSKKHQYGNEITDMVGEYVAEKNKAGEDTKESTRRR